MKIYKCRYYSVIKVHHSPAKSIFILRSDCEAIVWLFYKEHIDPHNDFQATEKQKLSKCYPVKTGVNNK